MLLGKIVLSYHRNSDRGEFRWRTRQGDTNGIQAEGGANGLFANGKSWCGVVGLSQSTTGGFGVYGEEYRGGTG